MLESIRRLLTSLRLLVAALSCAACTTIGTPAPGSPGTPASPADLRAREERALTALAGEDFAAARGDLLWIASRCEAGEARLRALLLLAAADLDPMNPAASPRAAAVSAGAYLLSGEASADRLPLARALFRLAADRGALDPGVPGDPSAALAELLVSCARDVKERSRDLPSVPATSLVERMGALQADLSNRSDSLAVVTDRVGVLEAELRRITSILRDDAIPLPPTRP